MVEWYGTCASARPSSLVEDCLLQEPEPGTAPLLGHGDTGPAELGELRPGRIRCRLQKGSRLHAELLLLGREGEVHRQRLRGSPSTRSATMFRRISDVPASIVLPRLRSCWCCQ